MPPATVEFLAHCMVHIVTELKSGPNPGTAILLDLRIDQNRVEPLLITNKHMIESCSDCSIFLSDLENGKRSRARREIPLPSGLSDWACHPDATIDLVALPIQAHLEHAEKGIGLPLSRPAIPDEMIASPSDLEAMPFAEEILVIGYPNALWDEANNLPLFSKGIASTHPGKDLNGKPEFIIDAACFPGSSGSPVFAFQSVKNEAISPKLLGILCAGEMSRIEGKITIRTKPDAEEDDVRLQIPMNFAHVIRANKLLDFRTKLFP
jgi:hypothetical protein